MSSQELVQSIAPAIPDATTNAPNPSEDSPYTHLLDDIALVKHQLDCLEIQYNPNNIANLLLEYDTANRVDLVINRIIDEPPDVQITFERNSPDKTSKSNSVPYRDSRILENDDGIVEVSVIKKNERVKERNAQPTGIIRIDSDDEDLTPSPNKYFKSVDVMKNPFSSNTSQQKVTSQFDEISTIPFLASTSSKAISHSEEDDQQVCMSEIERFLESHSKNSTNLNLNSGLDESVLKLNQRLNELKRKNPETDGKAVKASSSSKDIEESEKNNLFNPGATILGRDSCQRMLEENCEKLNQQLIESESSPQSANAKVQRVLDFASTMAKRDLKFGSISSVSEKVSKSDDITYVNEITAQFLESVKTNRSPLSNSVSASTSSCGGSSSVTHLGIIDENLDKINSITERFKSTINSTKSNQSSVDSPAIAVLSKPSEPSLTDLHLSHPSTSSKKDPVETSAPSNLSSKKLDTTFTLDDEFVENFWDGFRDTPTNSLANTVTSLPETDRKYTVSSASSAAGNSTVTTFIDSEANTALNKNEAKSKVPQEIFELDELLGLSKTGDKSRSFFPPAPVLSSSKVVETGGMSRSSNFLEPVASSSKVDKTSDKSRSSNFVQPVASSSKVEVLHCEASTSGVSSSTVSSVETNQMPSSSETPKDEPMPEYLPNLMEIFPDAETNYLRDLCKSAISKYSKEKLPKEQVLQSLIYTVMKNPDYPRRILPQTVVKPKNLSFEEKCQNIYAIVPNIDPEFLDMKCKELTDEDRFNAFVNELLTNKQYPTIKDYEKRKEMEKQMKAYTDNFTISAFLEVFPDPEDYFLNKKTSSHVEHSLAFLKERYKFIRIDEINRAYKAEQQNLTRTCFRLDAFAGVPRKTKRAPYECKLPSKSDINFLQEISYIKNKVEIENFIKNKKKEKEEAFRKAKANNELFTCGCCYDDEVMKDDVVTCPEGHIFCKNCVKQMGEIKVGERKSTVECMTAGCELEFTLKDMQRVLAPNAFSRFVKIKQSDEIKAAGIEGLVACPFCDFASIPPPEDKIFKCLNPDCMKESCRLCKEESHIPLRCDEVEKDAELSARLLIEEKMTEALMRECPKCKMKFVKSDGCNKMTCGHCKTKSCYICRKVVNGYSHFNGNGGDRVDLCPLYSDNDLLHVEAVKVTAEQIKNKLMRENPKLSLKNDPTLVLPEHQYKNKVQQPHYMQQQRGLVLNRVVPADVPRDNLPPVDLTRPVAVIPQNLLPHNNLQRQVADLAAEIHEIRDQHNARVVNLGHRRAHGQPLPRNGVRLQVGGGAHVRIAVRHGGNQAQPRNPPQAHQRPRPERPEYHHPYAGFIEDADYGNSSDDSYDSSFVDDEDIWGWDSDFGDDIINIL